MLFLFDGGSPCPLLLTKKSSPTRIECVLTVPHLDKKRDANRDDIGWLSPPRVIFWPSSALAAFCRDTNGITIYSFFAIDDAVSNSWLTPSEQRAYQPKAWLAIVVWALNTNTPFLFSCFRSGFSPFFLSTLYLKIRVVDRGVFRSRELPLWHHETFSSTHSIY